MSTYSIVGTSIVAVMRYLSIVSRTFAESKPGSTTIEPPRSRVGMKNAAPAWLKGVAIRNRTSSGHSHSASWISVIAAPLRYVPITPLGLPVVPPV